MIAAVAIVGAQNNPLYVRTFPNSEGDEALKVHYMVHCSLDTIEEKLLVKRPTEPTDLYLGLLYPTEENKLYGYISNANVKFIAAVNDKGSVMKEDAVGKSALWRHVAECLQATLNSQAKARAMEGWVPSCTGTAIGERRARQAELMRRMDLIADRSATLQMVAPVRAPVRIPKRIPEREKEAAPQIEPTPPAPNPCLNNIIPVSAFIGAPTAPALPTEDLEGPLASPPPTKDVEEPLAGLNVMNVVMVGAECAPWSKTGGLCDVVGTLPKELRSRGHWVMVVAPRYGSKFPFKSKFKFKNLTLAPNLKSNLVPNFVLTGGLGDVVGTLPKGLCRRGHRVMVVAPRYGDYQEAVDTGVCVQINMFDQLQEVVDYVFIDHHCYHGREQDIYGGGDQEALLFRCALLSKAAIEAVWHVPCGGVTYGDSNLTFIANDWHTALLPVYLQAHYRDYGHMTYARCIFVIHNMAHQGRAPFAAVDNLELSDEYKSTFFLDDPVGGKHMNVLKAGIMASQRLVAVSDGYAWECKTPEGGWGLHELLNEEEWKLSGIVNGMDYEEWSPEHDFFLQSDGFMNYTQDTLEEGKKACKMALQKEFGLPVDPDIPMLGFIDYQKGIDLIYESYDWLISQGVQLVFLGSGRDDLEAALRSMESRNPNQCKSYVGFSVKMAHCINAGVDILLMPSRFEPCGLNQLYAMAAGTVPVVHAVGGLRDTVKPFNLHDKSGTGWTFETADASDMRTATYQALDTYRNHKEDFLQLQKNGMSQDLSWDAAAKKYEDVMLSAKYQW
eukprot:gene8016-1246_t